MRRLAARSSPWMAVLAALLLAGAITVTLIFRQLDEAQSRLGTRVHEVMLWYSFQLEREVDRLDEALRLWRQRSQTPFAEVQTRMDIVLNRLEYLEAGDFGADEDATLPPLCLAVAAHIRRIAPLVAALPTTAQPREEVAAVRAQIRQLSQSAGQLTLGANQLAIRQREAARQHAGTLREALIATAVAMLVAVGLAFAALISQNRALVRERLRAEQIGAELRLAMEEAQSAARSKSTFLSTMSHEIRTPMNAVLAAASLLGESRLDAGQKRQLRMIDSSGKALLALIDDVLDFSRLEAGRAGFRMEAVDPRGLVEAVADIAAPLLRDQRLAFVAAVDPAVPALLRSDLHRLRQVLVNLVSNAIKFTETGGIALTLALEGDGRLRAEVADTGIGIAPQALAGLFREFEQADASVGPRYGGTGLGLAICKSIVEGLGGEIGVDSAPGRGSRFWFRLPVTVEAPPPLAADANGLACVCGVAAPVRAALALLLRAEGYACVDDTPVTLAVLAGDATCPVLVEGGKVLQVRAGTALGWPLTAARLADALGSRPAGAANPARAPLAGLSLLVAEDNPTNRDVMEQMLTHLGHTATMRHNGAEALAAVQQARFDGVLLDLRMPGLDGMATARAIRGLPGQAGTVKLMAVSANALESDRAQALAAGFDSFLAKPVTVDRLDAALRALLRGDAEEAHALPARGAVDAAQRQALRVAMRPGALERLVAAFWADLPERLALLAAIGGGESPRDVLHALSGAAGMLGYADVAAAAGRNPGALSAALAAALDADAAMVAPETVLAVRQALAAMA